ncbi:hypothetical protein D3C79_885790 [compost metagenome]
MAWKECLAPTATEVLSGEIARLVTTAGETVTAAVAVKGMPETVPLAVILAPPAS